MRQIAPLDFPDVPRNSLFGNAPTVKYIDPATLFVDESYQRSLSDRSIKLIRKIVSEWDWAAFKPPVVVSVQGKLEVIDGQHTAIAAITHGQIKTIPVMMIDAAAHADRADAFVRHNRDRIAVTSTQLHSALVAAGNEDALTIQQVCDRAGVKILRNPPPYARFAIGDTMAISTIASLINRRHAIGARRVLDVCVKGKASPVSSSMIRAVEHLLFANEYKGEIDAERISDLILTQFAMLEGEAKRFAAERKLPAWRALASVIFMKRRKTRHG